MKVRDDSISTNMQKDDREEENREHYGTESQESKGETFVSNRCRNKLDSEKTLISNGRRSRASWSCQELFLPNSSIPKRITTFEEKYVSRCLELIRNCALRAAAGTLATKVHTFPDDLSNLVESKSRDSQDMAKLAIQCPLVAGTEVTINSSDDQRIGSAAGNQSLMNILKSPLLQQFGSIDFDVNFQRKSLMDVNEPVYSDFANSEYIFAPGHKRQVSTSSTNSTCLDKSSSSSSATLFQGMLQCTWKDGLPHHVFSVDDTKEVYVANLFKVDPSSDKALDYIYTFHLREISKKDCDCKELELNSVGTMRVSTSITFSSNNSQVRETQFTLSHSSSNPTGEQQISNHTHRKNKILTRNVVKVFRSSHSYKQRSSAILEDTPWRSSEDVHNSISRLDAENDHLPSFELASIIVKETRRNHKEADLGGWGLKFLKKSEKDASLETFPNSGCTTSKGECSTSMNILIPAGLHGGPRTGVGGPSSLRERWISGGNCDCGGWDIGCPLTILNTRLNKPTNSQECKSIDIFVQGSKQDVPILKMVNVHEGLYYIHFQSNLSTLQSFAIAVAIIHSRSPVLR